MEPQENSELVGQESAERTLLESAGSGRLAHAWLLTGPRGIGKATLAYRMARYLLTYGATAQDVSEFSSLIKMRRPRTRGCAQVGLEATVYSAIGE